MTGDTSDGALLQLYNRELIALSAQVAEPRALEHPDVKATTVSVICGSEVTIELSLKDGRVEDVGYAVEACSLTRAVVAIMIRAARGKSRPEILAAAAALRDMLEKKSPPPNDWNRWGDWAALKILEPVIDYKARHETIMLPFVAVEKAFAGVN